MVSERSNVKIPIVEQDEELPSCFGSNTRSTNIGKSKLCFNNVLPNSSQFLPRQTRPMRAFQFRVDGHSLPLPPKRHLNSSCNFHPRASLLLYTTSLVSMRNYLESALGAAEEVRKRADYLSETISEAEQDVNYKLSQPVIEENASLLNLFIRVRICSVAKSLTEVAISSKQRDLPRSITIIPSLAGRSR